MFKDKLENPKHISLTYESTPYCGYQRSNTIKPRLIYCLLRRVDITWSSTEDENEAQQNNHLLAIKQSYYVLCDQTRLLYKRLVNVTSIQLE